jgi:hypothetical protein
MPFSIATSFGSGVKFHHFAKQTPNEQRNAYKGACAFTALRKAALTLFEMGRGPRRNGSASGGKAEQHGNDRFFARIGARFFARLRGVI